MKISILGSNWNIKFTNDIKEPRLSDCEGFCDYTSKTICIGDFRTSNFNNVKIAKLKTVRHELVHAFLYECGLAMDSWAGNEEIVDWLAFQSPKLNDLFSRVKL